MPKLEAKYPNKVAAIAKDKSLWSFASLIWATRPKPRDTRKILTIGDGTRVVLFSNFHSVKILTLHKIANPKICQGFEKPPSGSVIQYVAQVKKIMKKPIRHHFLLPRKSIIIPTRIPRVAI